MRRGEIRWYTFAQPDKRRPVLLLTRDGVIDTLNATLPDERWPEVERALLIACGFEPRTS